MAKPLVNTKKWDQNDFRLLVVLLLTVVYPVFVLAFFALYVFVLLPLMLEDYYGLPPSVEIPHQDGWYHFYWLFVSLLWLMLCAFILPCFQDKRKPGVSAIGMEIRESPEFPTKTHAVQPYLKVEETNEKERFSILTEKSRGSSASIEKGVCEEKADKESLEKSRESLTETNSLQKRSKLVESGEFLNEYIDTLDYKNKEQAECEVHVEKSKEGNDTDSDSSADEKPDSTDLHNRSVNKEDSSDDEDQASPGKKDEEKEKEETVIEPIVVQKGYDKQEAIPLKEAYIKDDNPSEDSEEAEELKDLESPVTRRKALPTIDTSKANESYECSMPTPKSAVDSAKRESNVVFLFVNPDTVDSEEGVKVVHAGKVEEEDDNWKKKKKVFMGGAKVLCLCNLEKYLLLVLQVTTDTDSEYSISKQSFV